MWLVEPGRCWIYRHDSRIQRRLPDPCDRGFGRTVGRFHRDARDDALIIRSNTTLEIFVNDDYCQCLDIARGNKTCWAAVISFFQAAVAIVSAQVKGNQALAKEPMNADKPTHEVTDQDPYGR